MKKLLSTILTAVFGFVACNVPENPDMAHSDRAAVTVSLVAETQAQSTYKLTITGSGMETIGPDEYAGGQTIELYVLEGTARTFHFERYNASGILIDTGTTIADIGSGINTVSVTLAAAIASPTITTQPATQSVTEGNPATFTITAIGMDLKYQWQKGTANINGETSVSYTTPILSLSDSGVSYRCVVSNPGGNVISTEAVLSVAAAVIAPVITTQPSDQTVTAGQTATFTVAATGSNLKYRWQKSMADIEGAVFSMYTTPVVSSVDSGSTYRCIVGNSAGNIESTPAMLLVTTTITAPSITEHPSMQTVIDGQTVTFTVVAIGTDLKYQWQKGGVDIEGAVFASYTTPATALADNGTVFRCKVTNSAGNLESDEAALTVKQAVIAPSIITHPADQSVTEGQIATFTIVATGTDLRYQWQKGIADISGANDASFTTGVTPISENNVTYQCVVSNSEGSLTSNPAKLTIVQKVVAPTITIQPSGQSVTEGQKATFSVTAAGTNLKYQWQKGNTDISDANGSTYNIFGTTMSDNNTTYRCIVRNSEGNVPSTTVTLTVVPKVVAPTITSHPANQNVAKGATATFKVVATGTDLKYRWQKGTTNIDGATDAIYTTPTTTYTDNGTTYRCIVSNALGDRISNTATLTVALFTLPCLIDDMSDGNDTNNLGFLWFYYDDNAGVQPDERPRAGPATNPSVIIVPYVENERHAFGNLNDTWKIKVYTFTLDKTTSNNFTTMPFTYGETWEASYGTATPFVGIGTMLASEGSYSDFTSATGVTFEIKSRKAALAVIFKVETYDIALDSSFCYYQTEIATTTTGWTEVTLLFTDLEQPDWTPTSRERYFNRAKVTNLVWEVLNNRNQTVTGDTLDIDNVIIK